MYERDNDLTEFIIKRILLLFPVLLGVSFIVFTIVSLTPGDPATAILGTGASAEEIHRLNTELGHYDPFFVRYASYIWGIVTELDFGNSFRTRQPVFSEIFARFPTTLRIASGAIVLAILIGIPIGVISAVKQYSIFDISGTVIAMFMASVPQFWLALMAILVFSLHLQLLPSTGIDTYRHYIMPIVTLSLPTAANIIRLTRTTMLEIIRQDYIRTARAKGATEFTVIMKHGFRNAMMPVITTIGINFGFLLGGTVLIEAIFAIPGVGTLTINSIRTMDIPQTMASVLFLAFIYVVMMLVVDVLYAYIDPRIKAKYVKKKVKTVGAS